jgi:pilus assembly protein Flp/PilA
MDALKRFFRDEQGATAVEYGLIVAAIAAAIVAIVFTLGTKIRGAFTTVDTEMGRTSGGGTTP